MTAAFTSLEVLLGACRGVLVDSNVLLDIATNDPIWSDVVGEYGPEFTSRPGEEC